jgi:hypothetical protein
MPDRDVRTIRDLIYYRYAKIIARRVFSAADGKAAKQQHYGFIKTTFRQLQSVVPRNDRPRTRGEPGRLMTGRQRRGRRSRAIERGVPEIM